MRYIAAQLLLSLGGNTAASAEDIKTLLTSVGVEVEEERLTALLAQTEGKDLNELVAAGASKLASVPSGGAAAGAASSGAAAGGAAEAAAAAPAEEEEEEDDDMGFGLFD
ncbi:ribosomal protein 60S [Conidiobolus coronatus NRRL 28638]|uniref:Ribosomal protein 60S n=1 Tax=Conidiobolus coronatus (strain ATCC 28846 / CBS 209.66 / NRRL 28638) TaxID=796925 RepID=A0A137PF35_CONC2|nr:ribosomal protein 60S [Conidiobolus coronatus NRRL 28638]|eukprot:KXN73587.1 ribosomal protein 60S [Conidiobolus coronatus NRRL 28638]